jgi:NADH:ubiquinone oxidoreductase subunit C
MTHATPQIDRALDPAAHAVQREQIDAALRSSEDGWRSHVDPRGLSVATEAAAQVVEAFASSVTGWTSFRDEVTITVQPDSVHEVLTFVRDALDFRLLSDISPCDWLDARERRFSVSWHVTKLTAGAPRLRIQTWIDEGQSLRSVIDVYPTADWHEREAFDFFGIEFSDRAGLRRLIMADDWVGHPARKDYPLGGEPVKFTDSLREI